MITGDIKSQVDRIWEHNFHFDKLVEYCVALANEGGGKVVLGVTDRRPRRIVGTTVFAEPGRTEAGLHERLAHRIPIEEVRLPEGRVLVVHVPARLPGTAWQIGGRYLKRAGDELAALSDAELRAMFAETGPDFSAEPCPGASLTDLSPDAIAVFRNRWAAKTRDERRALWSDELTLANAELLIDGSVTYAALILFGTRAALGRLLAQAELVFEYRSSEASGPAADREEYREGFFLWHDAVWNKINLRNERQSYQDGLFRVELPTFDEVVRARSAAQRGGAPRLPARRFGFRKAVRATPGGGEPGRSATGHYAGEHSRPAESTQSTAGRGAGEGPMALT